VSRYVQAYADRLLREYCDADSLPAKESALRNCIDGARLIENTVLPAMRGDVERFRFVQGQCNRMLDLARPWVEKHPANFPKKPDHTLQILDILDGMETTLRLLRADVDRLVSRRADRAAAQRKDAA
jgi:hypothetical protein